MSNRNKRLEQKYQEALRRAEAYREQHGDPIEALSKLLGSIGDDKTYLSVILTDDDED